MLACTAAPSSGEIRCCDCCNLVSTSLTYQSNLLNCTACPPCSRRCKNNHIPADCETYFRLSNLKTLVLGPGPGNGTLYVGNDVGIFTCVTPGTLPEEETVDKCTLLLPKVAPPS